MLTIRRYTSADHDAILHLHMLALQKAGTYLGSGPWDKDLHAIEKVYLNNHGEFLVGECDGRLVAMGGLSRNSPTCAEIRRMRVHPDYQGRGFGTLILSELEARARSIGYTTLHLDTTTIQIAAQKLYEKHGFREVGRQTSRQFEEILYEKELRQDGALTDPDFSGRPASL